jgi:hypothetical protein
VALQNPPTVDLMDQLKQNPKHDKQALAQNLTV